METYIYHTDNNILVAKCSFRPTGTAPQDSFKLWLEKLLVNTVYVCVCVSREAVVS